MRRFLLILPVVAVVAASASCRDEPNAAPAAAPVFPRLLPPLADAKAGEWLRIEAGREAQLYRVVGAGDYYVEVETTSYHDQAPVGTPQKSRWWRNSFGIPEDECVIRAIDPDRVQIGDVWYDCWRVFATSKTGQERYYWISDRVPVHGLVKVASVRKGVADEVNAARLGDFGVESEKGDGKPSESKK